MADYTPTQNFTALRGTTPADPAIFDTEFVAVQTAVATKLDKTGGTLTGSLTGTSASFPSGVTANITGDVTGNVTGNLTGNVLGTPSITATNITGTAAGLSIGGSAALNVLSNAGVGGVGLSQLMHNSSGGYIASGATVAGTSLQYPSLDNLGNIGLGGAATGTYLNVGGGVYASTAAMFQRIS